MHTESEINLKHINKRAKKNPKLSKPFDLCSVKKRLSWNKIWNCFHLSRMSFLSCKLHDAYPSLGSQIREKAKKIEIPTQITSWGTEIAIALNQTLRTKWLYTKLFLYYLVLKISLFLSQTNHIMYVEEDTFVFTFEAWLVSLINNWCYKL